MKFKFFLSFTIFLFTTFLFSQKHKSFEIKNGDFYYNSQPIYIKGGELHYSRVPHQYWNHRFKMMKAMGLNAVTTYVFWNFHEVSPGNWDWTGDRNLKQFIKEADKEGLLVILRPGPYVCAEWEFGGYPWWLQNINGLKIREDNELFLNENKKYLTELYEQVKDLQITKGGPVIMIQGENEFGSFVAQRKDISLESHRSYNAKVIQQLKDVGFNVPMFTSDGSWLFEGGTVKGALPTANGEHDLDKLKKVVNEYNNNEGPYMVAEFYPGWLAHWAEKFPRINASKIARQTEKFLKNNISFNYYMVHGGTNFGFTSGANYDDNSDIQPDLTSYDYDAPISEAGWRTPKFDSLRNVIAKYSKEILPNVPDPIHVIEINNINLNKVYNLFDYIDNLEVINADKPMTFEELNQGHGFVLYRRHFNQPISGVLDISGLRDYATVYINGKKIGELNRIFKNYTLPINIPFNATLEILVENWGRINYGSKINENTKGIISPVKIGDIPITGDWEMIKIPFDNNFKEALPKTPLNLKQLNGVKNLPVIYSGEFTLDNVGDTFIDMQSFGKGIVFVNGKNLGRYWKNGPQQTLYLPGAWLKKGKNEIYIYDQLNESLKTKISTVKIPVLDVLNNNN